MAQQPHNIPKSKYYLHNKSVVLCAVIESEGMQTCHLPDFISDSHFLSL